MKKTVFLLLIWAMSMLSTAFAQDTLWTRTYGGNSEDRAWFVLQTAGSGYLIVGSTSSYGAGGADVYLIKTDSQGDTLWTHTYGGAMTDWSKSAVEVSSGGYLIAAKTISFGAGSWDMYIIKTDGFGDTIWTRTYGGSQSDVAHSVVETSNGDFVIGGSTKSYGSGNFDFYLIKINPSGDTLWTRTYGGTGDDIIDHIASTNDGGYLLSGYTDSFGAGNDDVFVIKIDSLGIPIWTRTYGGSSIDKAWSGFQTTDGGYIIAGETMSYGSGMSDCYIIKTNSLGDTVWTRTFGGSDDDVAHYAKQSIDGDYFIAGATQSYGAGEWDVYVLKVNTSGDTIWTHTYGGIEWDVGLWAQQTNDEDYVIAGYSRSYSGNSNEDVYLIKIAGDRIVPIPTLPEWGLIILSVLLLVSAVWWMKRRKTVSASV